MISFGGIIMPSTWNIYILSNECRDIAIRICNEQQVLWSDIEKLFEELKYRFNGFFEPASSGGVTRVMITGIIATFDYPHLPNPPITRILRIKRYLQDIGANPC